MDLDQRLIRYRRNTREHLERIRYEDGLLTTLPLPVFVNRCEQTPPGLREASKRLLRNRVLSVALAVEGQRPEAPGHWRYYGDESLIFTRLIYLHEFDSLCAPPEGWCLLAEVTQPGEEPMLDESSIVRRVTDDAFRARALPEGSRIIGQRMMVVDPAYVVFTLDNRPVIEACRNFLESYGVTTLGRYGRWQYSSMASCMREGLEWADKLGPGTPARAPGGSSQHSSWHR